MKIFTVAEMPDGLAKAWLQHLRDFDIAHPGCHFEVLADAPDMPFDEVIQAVKIDPGLDVFGIMLRGKG
jgi:hypothetical protein